MRIVMWSIIIDSRSMSVRTSNIDKELTTSGIGRSGIGHGQSPGEITDLVRLVSHFIWDTALSVARVLLPITRNEATLGRGSTCTTMRGRRVAGMGTTKLTNETRDHTMKMNTIIKSIICQTYEIADRNLYRRGAGGQPE